MTLALDPLDAYRRMFAGPQNGCSAWWYLGAVFAEMDGFPMLPILHVETVMIYKTTTLSADSFRMDWWEIGYMRDPVTGDIASTWVNPLSGDTIATPQKFEEGPSHFTIARSGGGLDVQLVQKHARVESVQVDFSEQGGRVLLDQTERKVRGFPRPDGTMPSLDSDEVSRTRTRLSLFSAQADLAEPVTPSSGSYEFELPTASPWMGMGDRPGRTMVRGIMHKAADVQQKLNPTGWARLMQLFPERFEGDRIVPVWE